MLETKLFLSFRNATCTEASNYSLSLSKYSKTVYLPKSYNPMEENLCLVNKFILMLVLYILNIKPLERILITVTVICMPYMKIDIRLVCIEICFLHLRILTF